MRARGIFRFSTLLVALDLLNAFSAKSPILQTVTDWLDGEKVAWGLVEDPGILFPRDIIVGQPILEVRASTKSLYYLHILKSPSSMDDCLSPTYTRDMTNYVQYLNAHAKRGQLSDNSADNDVSKISIIHLHEDVWHSKTDIVQNRLRIRLGGSNSSQCSRVFARKTTARRIDAGTAIPFLQNNHLWGATKARFYYGLYLPAKGNFQEDILVAVGTFSNKRSTYRGIEKARSVELIRFCTRSDGVVVGGITKLIGAFLKDQHPIDNIVTVVDRDWGPGDGWHSIGFSSLHVSAPLLMVVKDGIRRHLVGAGIKNSNIQPGSKINNNLSTGRPGIEEHVLEELAGLTANGEALNCLDRHLYYPVYDAGVERLLLVVSKAQSGGASSEESLPSAHQYAATFHSKNVGISALLGHIVAQTATSLYGRSLSQAKINDSMASQSQVAAWRASGGKGKCGALLYKASSSLDPRASVEVREREGGWCILGIVGGAKKSIRHGNFKMTEKAEERVRLESEEGRPRLIDSSVMVFEYLRTMAAVALTGLEFRKAHPDEGSDRKTELSFLYLGYGAGSLSRFMANTIPGSRHVAIELDEGVVSAAHQCGLLSPSNKSRIRLEVGDALTYRRSTSSDPFDVVFVDIFDGENLLPPEFYSKGYLNHVVYQDFLGGLPDGIIVHNFHTGGKARASQLEDAIKNYRSVFSTTLAVESVGSRPTGGNTILLATNQRRLDASSETQSWYMAGMKAQERSGINFDVIARTTQNFWIS